MYTVWLKKKVKGKSVVFDLCYEHKYVWRKYGGGEPFKFARLSGTSGASYILNAMLPAGYNFISAGIDKVSS